jgi:hypothetical protein
MSFSDLLTNNLPLLLDCILGIAVIVLIFMVLSLNRKLKKFLIGVDSKNITDSLASVSSDLGELKSFRTELEKYLVEVEQRLRKSIRSVHTIRFNPWHGTGEGGSQSFATAFMNEDGDGVVISSLYSRDHVSVFGKPLKKRSSPHELSTEEKQAVDEASAGLK